MTGEYLMRAWLVPFVLLGLTVSACTSAQTPPASGAPAGTATAASPSSAGAAGQLVIGALEEPPSLSALVDLPHHFPEHVPQTLIFDSLTQFLPDGTVAPKLATKWQISADNLTYTFTLDGKAKFHDGSALTAEDVKFTFDTLQDPKTGSSDEGVDRVEKTEVVDAQTVRVTLKAVRPQFLAEGGSRGIVPKKALEGKDIGKDDFNKKPIGSGPYQVKTYTPGQSLVLEAVPGFYRGEAKIKTIVFKFLSDQNVILTQLRSGELGYALVTPRDIAAIQNVATTQVVEAKTYRFFDITPNYQRAYWQDQKVREAVLGGIDRQSIVDKVLLGHGQVIDANVSPTWWAYNPSVTKHPFDQAKAKAALDGAGWTAGSDGIRAKAGTRLSIGVMLNNYDRTLEQSLLVAQQNLKDIGVDLRVEKVEPGVFGARRKSKDYDALSRIWNPVYDPDQSGLVKTGNFYGYSNPKVDALSATALSTPDQAKRKVAYDEIQQILSQDVARLFLYTENELHAVPKALKGYQPHPVNFFWNIKDWTLEAR